MPATMVSAGSCSPQPPDRARRTPGFAKTVGNSRECAGNCGWSSPWKLTFIEHLTKCQKLLTLFCLTHSVLLVWCCYHALWRKVKCTEAL